MSLAGIVIIPIENIAEIKSIFLEYLNYLSQFYEIKDRAAWCETAWKRLQRNWVKDDWHIYLLKESKAIIGFSIVNKHLRFNDDGFAVSEFYIQKEYEKKGYGRKLAEYVFAQFSGNWEVAVSLKNKAAKEFWGKVISTYTAGKFREKKTDSFSGYGFVFNKMLII